MPRGRTPLRQIREVLRLKFEKQMSSRQIGPALGIGRTTAREYIQRAQEAKLTWPLPEEMNDEGLQKLLFPSSPLQIVKALSKPFPDFLYLHQELKKKGVTLQLFGRSTSKPTPKATNTPSFASITADGRRPWSR